METNRVTVEMECRSINESFARIAAAAFITPLDPTYGDVNDIKTAVSEAVTNAIIHGYNQENGLITMTLSREERTVTITVSDSGIGIENINEARTPLYTTKPDMERSGMGFTVMETFMDSVNVVSQPGKGTVVTMVKTLEN
jgi:stage II sporulation protein AB (anti-sigma F factor)